jgi:hypothetical protein
LKPFARWEDGQFVRDLDYLKADMNSHPEMSRPMLN